MRVYSETILRFVQKCQKQAREIIAKETPFIMRRERFEYGGQLYPLHIVVFEGSSLGYFDANHYRIGLNKCLIHQAKDSVVKNILRHELAHYACYLMHGPHIKPHGAEFKRFCLERGWGEAVNKASMDLDAANQVEGDLQSEKILSKIKALLRLSASANAHESQLATLKANQLLIRHNLSALNLEQGNSEQDKEAFCKTLLKLKRKNAKICAIYDICAHFMVRPILHYGRDGVELEVIGTRSNVELAEYVVNFLDTELERLWTVSKKNNHLKGTKAKNSFFRGIARGHEQKMRSVCDDQMTRALTKVHFELETQTALVYPRLSKSYSQAQQDQRSFSAGVDAGRSLTVNQALSSKNQKTKLLQFFS